MPVVVAAIDLFKGSVLVLSRALSLAASPLAIGPGLDDDRPEHAGVVHVVHVAEPNLANVEPTAIDAPDLTGYDPSAVRKFCDRHLADFVKREAKSAAPRLEIHNVTGDPSSEIVSVAAKVDADVIVLATHGRTGIKRLLLGSVAEKVVRHAGCPVFVVREKHHAAPHR
jgi:nucleotide-binding universal stress UspA family protein